MGAFGKVSGGNQEIQGLPLFHVEGVGLHGGQKFRVEIFKGQKGRGILFFAKVPNGTLEAPALWTRLSGTTRSTALVLRGPQRARVELRTIEHLLSSLFVLGLPDLEVYVVPAEETAASNPSRTEIFEIPVLDGSSRPWVEKLSAIPNLTDLIPKIFSRTVWRISRSKTFTDGSDRFIEFLPPAGSEKIPLLKFSCSVDFGLSLKQSQSLVLDWSDVLRGFREYSFQIAGARTFGFKSEIESLLSRGLALGASLSNAILLDGETVQNEGGFRFPNELAAHKLLDALGDFALLGAPFIGEVRCHKAGHALHCWALREAIEQEVLVPGQWSENGHFVEQA